MKNSMVNHQPSNHINSFNLDELDTLLNMNRLKVNINQRHLSVYSWDTVLIIVQAPTEFIIRPLSELFLAVMLNGPLGILLTRNNLSVNIITYI